MKHPKTTNTTTTFYWAILFYYSTTTVHSFTTIHTHTHLTLIPNPNHHRQPRWNPLTPLSSKTPEYNDFEDFSTIDDVEAEACRDVTSEFYRRARNEEAGETRVPPPPPPAPSSSSSSSSPRSTSPPASYFTTRQQPPPQQQQQSESSSRRNTTKKFTGSLFDDTTQQSSYTSNANNNNNNNPTLTPRERMMRSEFNLVSAASSPISLKLQAGLLLLTLVSVLWVGWSGGITDGSDRFGDMEDVLDVFENLDPLDFSKVVEDGDASGGIIEEGSKNLMEGSSKSAWI